MEEKKMISYFEHEGMMVKLEEANERLVRLCIMLLFALLISNALWIML